MNAHQKAVEFASLHQAIHQVESDNLPSLKDILNRNLQRTDKLSVEAKTKVSQYISQLPDGFQVCHMDFHPDNILYSSSGPIIIGWMTAVRGNPFADVARTLVILNYAVLPSTIPAPIKETIQSIRDQFGRNYIQSYLQKVDGSMDQVEWFLPIMAARLCEGIPNEEKDILADEVQARLSTL